MWTQHDLVFVDINECETEGYVCGTNDTATCKNNIGSFTCECHDGFNKTTHNANVTTCDGVYVYLIIHHFIFNNFYNTNVQQVF